MESLPAFTQAQALAPLIWRWPLAEPIDPAAYAIWRENLPLLSAPVSSKTRLPAEPSPTQQDIIDQLMAFKLAASTPLAAMQLVADLQQQWEASSVMQIESPRVLRRLVGQSNKFDV